MTKQRSNREGRAGAGRVLLEPMCSLDVMVLLKRFCVLCLLGVMSVLHPLPLYPFYPRCIRLQIMQCKLAGWGGGEKQGTKLHLVYKMRHLRANKRRNPAEDGFP